MLPCAHGKHCVALPPFDALPTPHTEHDELAFVDAYVPTFHRTTPEQ